MIRTIKSFVKRQGRMTIGQNNALMRLWSRYGITWAAEKLNFSAIFGNNNPVYLEIGFGNGDVLLHTAQSHPENNYIGIEVHAPGVGHLLGQLDAEHISNVRVLREDALLILTEGISRHSLSGVAIYFPDPWPKRRHHKRRLIQTSFVDVLATVLQPDGELRLATDWQDYALHMLAVLERHARFYNSAGPFQFSERPPIRPLSRFEKRGLARGYRCYDLCYKVCL